MVPAPTPNGARFDWEGRRFADVPAVQSHRQNATWIYALRRLRKINDPVGENRPHTTLVGNDAFGTVSEAIFLLV
jgi:hypothetical protein